MKSLSILFTSFILSTLFFCPPLYAQEVRPSPRSVKGFYELGLFTQVSTRRVVEEISPGEVFEGDAVSTKVIARIGVKPLRRLELYLQGGTANLHIDEFNDYRGDYSFAYGGGLILTLYEYPGPDRFRIIAQGDALTFTTDDTILTTIQGQSVNVTEEIRWLEYTVQSAGIWRVNNWEPYVGVRLSWLDSTDEIKDPRVGKLTLEEDKNIGIMLGTDVYLDPRENFAVNIEASLIDQESFKIGVKLWY